MGVKRLRGRGGFIDSVLDLVDAFYAEVVHNLRAWSASPPRMREPVAVPETPSPLVSTTLSSEDGPYEREPDEDAAESAVAGVMPTDPELPDQHEPLAHPLSSIEDGSKTRHDRLVADAAGSELHERRLAPWRASEWNGAASSSARVRAGQAVFRVAEDRGFEPLRAVNPTRFPSERHRPLGESSAQEVTGLFVLHRIA